jgi:hypothetical protein
MVDIPHPNMTALSEFNEGATAAAPFMLSWEYLILTGCPVFGNSWFLQRSDSLIEGGRH